MNGSPSWIEPPPDRHGVGCFVKGCLILVVFVIALAVSFWAGTYYAARYLRTEYFSSHRDQLPASQAAVEQEQEVRARWDTFEKAARAKEFARIELSADDLNALIAAEPRLRGNAYVTIEESTAHLQVSFPLPKSRLLGSGRYINAQCSIQSAPSGRPEDARISSIVVNGKSVGEDFLSWQYGAWSFKRYVTDWTGQTNLNRFEISDGKVILQTNGSTGE